MRCKFSIIILACTILTACNSGATAPSSNNQKVKFPTPYAGAYYPIYNFGPNQYIVPDQSMPFDKISTIFIAFAHAYSNSNGAILNYESGQPDEPNRLALLVQTAKTVNPNIKFLISLGWGQKDWTFINNDYVNKANLFVPSVINFIRANHLDGFDIDDEGIGDDSGNISQANFDGVISELSQGLSNAGRIDGKTYYLTITPAGNNEVSGGLESTQVSQANFKNFDLINIQNYYNSLWGSKFTNTLVSLGYPSKQIAVGISSENCTQVIYPNYTNMAGIFNWTMSSDMGCSFANTSTIAQLINYTSK